MGEQRERKKRETRQRISDVATDLFLARGFESVTLEEVAAGASVSKMTVFNYFARKEDLILDRQDDLKLTFFRDAIRSRPEGQSPIAALRALMSELRDQGHPLVRFDRQTVGWWRFVSASPSLEARLHELYDKAAEGLAIELGGPSPDGQAKLAAGIIVVSVRTARQDAIRVFQHASSPKKASAAFINLVKQGFSAVETLASKHARWWP